MSKRQRPGKRERAANAAKAFAGYRAKVVSDNMREGLKPERIVYGRGFAKSSANRDRLREGSSSVGFHGPRGFWTPKDTVGKREAAPGQLGSVTPRPTAKPSKRFNRDGL